MFNYSVDTFQHVYRHTFLVALLLIHCANLACCEPARGNSESRLTEIIRNVRANEVLYDHIEVRLRVIYRTGDRKIRSSDNIKITEQQNKLIHYVSQNGMFRMAMEADVLSAEGEMFLYDRTRLFDGRTTRLLTRHNKIANIIDGRSTDELFVLPHMLLLRTTDMRIPLSTYLGGEKALRRNPMAERKPGLTVHVTYAGQDEWNGLRCQKVSIAGMRAGQTSYRWVLWLAEDRNYLPVHTLAFTHRWSSTLPLGEGTVQELQEIVPGVWFPMQAEVTSYNPFALKRQARQEFQWQEQYFVESVSLEPDYDFSYFHDLEIPDGTAVYIVRDGEIVDSYRQGAPKAPGGPSAENSFRYWWIVWANVAAVAVIGAVFLVRKRMSNGKAGSSDNE